MNNSQILTELTDLLLNTDEGIGGDAFLALLALTESVKGEGAAQDLAERAEATDGRFYFP